MSASRQDPRANQKARTRAAIVTAAEELRTASGATPTVAEAATLAGVARATAYRYFPTQEALEVEVADINPEVAATEEVVAALDTDDVEARLHALFDAFGPLMFAEEAHFRRALWVYLDTWLRSDRSGAEAPAVREGRRVRWLDAVLEPVGDIPEEQRRRLRSALALTLGSESLVVMRDVCGLEEDGALDVLRWAAVALLRAGLAEGVEGKAPGPDRAGSC